MQALVSQAWGSVWVAGEVQRPRPHRSGHLYLELVEKGDGAQPVASLGAVIWRSHLARIQQILRQAGVTLDEGVQIRCHGRLDFYPPHGKLQLVIDQIDPIFTEGQLERQRRETLEALVREELLERNKGLPLPVAPLAVGLVTSEGSAAYHDFLTSLAGSGYAFRVLFVHAAVQGKGAEREVAGALELLGRQALDCVALVRGGGSRSDLAAFDSRAVAEAVARCPLPVLTGLGHEIDFSVADRVAHAHEKTPTAVAEALVQRVAQAEASLLDLTTRVARRAERRMAVARQTVRVVERDLRAVRGRLRHAGQRLATLAASLRRSGRARVRAAGARRIGT
ncbi:MAG: exodeoxyribonuclease VII large subunit, partial [Thermoanaerobaculia bacterium]